AGNSRRKRAETAFTSVTTGLTRSDCSNARSDSRNGGRRREISTRRYNDRQPRAAPASTRARVIFGDREESSRQALAVIANTAALATVIIAAKTKPYGNALIAGYCTRSHRKRSRNVGPTLTSRDARNQHSAAADARASAIHAAAAPVAVGSFDARGFTAHLRPAPAT